MTEDPQLKQALELLKTHNEANDAVNAFLKKNGPNEGAGLWGVTDLKLWIADRVAKLSAQTPN